MPLCAQPCPHQGTDTSKKDHVFAQFCCHSSGLKMVHDAQKIRSPKWRYSPIEAFCRGIPSPITSSIYLKSMVNKVPKQKIEETKKPKMSLNHGFCLPHIWPAKKGNPPAQAWRLLKPPRSWGFLDQIYGSCMLMYCITSLLNHMPFCCRKKHETIEDWITCFAASKLAGDSFCCPSSQQENTPVEKLHPQVWKDPIDGWFLWVRCGLYTAFSPVDLCSLELVPFASPRWVAWGPLNRKAITTQDTLFQDV